MNSNPELVQVTLFGVAVVLTAAAGAIVVRWLLRRLLDGDGADDETEPIEETVADARTADTADAGTERVATDDVDASPAPLPAATTDDDPAANADTCTASASEPGNDVDDEATGETDHAEEDKDGDGLLPALRGALARLSDRAHRLPRRALTFTQRLLFGSSDSYTTRIATFVMVLSASIVGVGMWATATSDLDTSGDSGLLVELFLSSLTSLWTYVAIVVLIALMLRVLRDRRLAGITADKTAFSKRTVLRLAAEARSTDGCTTVVVGPSDSPLEITNRVLDALGIDAVDADHEVFAYMGDVTEPGPEHPDEWTPEPPTGASERADDGGSDSVGDQLRQARLELASALSFRDVLWRFAMPALATFVALLILVQIWVAPWVYGLMLAGSILAGAAVYQYAGWRRRRKLQALRSPDEPMPWTDIATMVKRVETEDTTMFYGWVAGRRYVDYDGVRLAATVARSAHAHVHDEEVPPALQQKFARRVQQFIPNLRGYEDREKEEVMDALGDTVASADRDIMPKHELAERVIFRDRDQVGGIGYDPRIVSECYDRLVPYALVEEPVTVTTGDGTTSEMTAVRLRTSPIPPEKANAEAEFSTAFDPTSEPEYRLPEVDQHHDLPRVEYSDAAV